MTKKGLSAILKTVFIIAFNIVFFLLKGCHNTPLVWVSYVFVHLAYLALLITPCFVPRGKDVDSVSYPLHVISGFYFGLTLIACGAFMYFDQIEAKYSIITHVVLTALFLILFISYVILGKNNQESEEVRTEKVQFIDQCCTSLELLRNNTTPSDELYAKISDVYDLIHSSPIRSNESVQQLEAEATSILQDMLKLDLSQSKEKCIAQLNHLTKLFQNRNTLLK